MDSKEFIEELAARFRAGDTLRAMEKEYHRSTKTLARLIRTLVPCDEYETLLKQRQAATMRKYRYRWRPGCGPVSKYQRGQIRGKAARGWVPIGTIKMRNQAYYWVGRQRRVRTRAHFIVKVQDEPGDFHGNWKRLDRYVWEKANGPIPEGYLLYHKDGNSLNDHLDNLLLVSESENFILKKQAHHEAFGERRLEAIRKSVRKSHVHRDRGRVQRIRQLIPVPACVKLAQESAWNDNRGEFDDDDLDFPGDLE